MPFKMTAEISQCFQNTLEPVRVDKHSLQHALDQLRRAVRRGVGLIEANSTPPDPGDNSAFGAIYHGDIGIVIMALRLQRQAQHLATPDVPAETLISELRTMAAARVNPYFQKFTLRAGRLSPIGSSSLGAAVVRIIVGMSGLPPRDGERHRIHRRDIAALREAVDLALQQGDQDGADEVLYGRAGLLISLLNIQSLAQEIDDETSESLLRPIFADIPSLVDTIMETGIQGARDYVYEFGDRESLPLMWPWHDKFYAGAIHGVCGILAVLLACGPDVLSSSHQAVIARTISAICRISIAHSGHLPSSFPSHPPSRRSPLVQICHGPPGLLILLSNARNFTSIVNEYWEPEWDEAILLSGEKIWQQGLLYKGGGLCHGITGNAWPFLLQHDDMAYSGSETDNRSADVFLSRALAFMLEARETQPFNRHQIGSGMRYRMPDTPYSLFEGLAGTVTAWAETCVVISARLREMEVREQNASLTDDMEFQTLRSDELGFPGFSTRGYL